jgi:polysaccharide export outer membrane protein
MPDACRPARRVLVVLLCLLPAACATVDTGAMTQAPAEPDASPVLPAQPYRIGIGDVLDIRLPLSPELDDEVTVRPDGGISTTVVGDATAAGRTVPELEATLEQSYESLLKAPHLSVIVKQAQPLQVFVAGQVANPGALRVDAGAITLAQAIAQAGGIKLAGDPHHVFILRRGADGRARFLSTRFASVAGGLDPNADVRLARFDVVFVPRTGIAEGYQYFNQYLQQFVPVSWGFSYVLNEARSTVTQAPPAVSAP